MVRKSKAKPSISAPQPQRTVALCYIRLSYTRDEEDTNSPERQRANIQRICDRYGWTPEWYEDVGGHKSGQSEDNRPQWLQLKTRLSDPDIAALVANDLSRLHRNLSSISTLVETLEVAKIELILAASDMVIDTSTLMGQMLAQFNGLMDAYFAKDIAVKTKDSIAYRKRRGITVGRPPFGTVRNETGYLIPTPEGAWYLPTGTLQKGMVSENPPIEGALWRGYYNCAQYMLEIYAEGAMGLEKIAYRLNTEGWAFRNAQGEPRSIDREDIRRVIANWKEYGGMVVGKRSKERPGYEDIDADEAALDETRAVFPVDLLRRVGLVRRQRTIRPRDQGVKRETKFYPLSVITYCAHCDRLAHQHQDPRLRSVLNGRTDTSGRERYKHKTGVKCGCRNRSVTREDLEGDFVELVRLLTIDTTLVDVLTELAIQADKVRGVFQDEHDLESQKAEAIALCRRRIDAAVVLFEEGRIDYDGYRRRIDKNEREIIHWQSRTTESEKISLELAMCIDAVGELDRLWETAKPEQQQSLARNLFDEIVYDLDQRQVMSFKLKPWAERFLVLRAAVYGEEQALLAYKNKNSPDVITEGNHMSPRGLKIIIRYTSKTEYSYTIALSVRIYHIPAVLLTDRTDVVRNEVIRLRYAQGDSLLILAKEFGISLQRVHQIVHRKNK